MRIIILGIDALDINMIEKLDLKALKHAQYGELKVPLSSISGYPRSSSVWATFLTGKEHEIEFTKAENGINMFAGLTEETFVDWKWVKGINVPFRNHEIDTLTKLVRLRNKLSYPETIQKMVDVHNSRTKEIFNEIINTDERYKVIFAYFQTLDTLQHALFLRPNVILKLYRCMEIHFADIKQKLSEDTIIIVSDHGFEKGTHSYTGMYSCSHVINPKPTNITDFYGLIKEFL